MGALEAPGINGLPAGFFQKHWSVVKTGVTEFVLATFAGNIDISAINETLIVLILKIPSPVTIAQFQPISLCSVVYKSITKIIADRIKPLLPNLVGSNQCRFIITDNIIIAQEIIHSMGVKKGKKGFVAIKVDLEKVYDRHRWDFVVSTLEDIGMPAQWIDVVHKCISTSSMRLLLNGNMTDSFRPSRGIRQGDPLSPYLFVLCMERLSRIVLSQVDAEASIKRCLSEFCAMSSQKVSLSKSRIRVSKNGNASLARAFSRQCGIPLTACLGKYLGVPLLHERVTKNTFVYVVENVHSRLSGWKSANLSLAGCATLVKSVTSGIPNHIMQTNLLPSSTIDSIDKANRKFLWANNQSGRKIHLLPWEKIFQEKKQGGLGIRSSRDHNRALLMKLLWRFLKEPNALWVRILKGKYMKQGNLFHFIGFSGKKSFLCWNLLKILPDFKEGIVWFPRNGGSTHFWTDSWIEEKPLKDLVDRIPMDELNKKVNEYILLSGEWNLHLLGNLFPPSLLMLLAAFKILPESEEVDVISWSKSSSGIFSTKSAFQMITPTNNSDVNPLLISVWKLKLPLRILFYTWLALQGGILTNEERKSRHIIEYDSCGSCSDGAETILYVLRDCEYSMEVCKS